MAETVRHFFETLSGRVTGEQAAGVEQTYVFNIDGAGVWTVDVHNGVVDVAEGDRGGDCTISTSAETFERILSGDQNPTQAFMAGKVRSDNLTAAMKLQKLLG